MDLSRIPHETTDLRRGTFDGLRQQIQQLIGSPNQPLSQMNLDPKKGVHSTCDRMITMKDEFGREVEIRENVKWYNK